MGKKPIPKVEARRTSSRAIKKQKRPDEEEFYEDAESKGAEGRGGKSSGHGYSDSDSDGSDEDSNSEESEQLKPENMAVRNMQFREKRGTKMNYLISRKKEEEEDPFWAAQGQTYFGNLDDGDDEEEDYEQSSSGRDEFDSDFDQTESEHEPEEGAEMNEADEEREQSRRKRRELMRKIHAPAPLPRKVLKTAAGGSGSKKPGKAESEKKTEPGSRYIHELFNQEQLLGEAATTEYFNWLSLKKLISIETEKIGFMQRQHHVEGPKVIYRNRFNAEGQREVSYELEGVTVHKVEDLTRAIHQN